MSPVLPTGAQHRIALGRQSAVVTEVGATLRSYVASGHEFLDTFDAAEMSEAARGQVLVPWPNRVDHGRYRFAGKEMQLAINEVGFDNALHGLARWINWRIEERAPHRVLLGAVLHPQEGYPFALAVAVDYRLTDDGLIVTTTGHNVGPSSLPFGAGHHPYLSVGGSTIDAVTMSVPARTVLVTDGRGIPTGRRAVEGSGLDFRTPRTLAAAQLDTTYTDLVRDSKGIARVEIETAEHLPRATLWMDSAYRYLQVFTGDALPARAREGIAVEPMTCSPNAFNNSMGLEVLDPGDSLAATWGLVGVA
jgi:aldose 1-epimerase